MQIKFELTDKEIERAKLFEAKHSHRDINKGAIGGYIDYIFSPNSIFRSLAIKCKICNKELNITDYDVW